MFGINNKQKDAQTILKKLAKGKAGNDSIPSLAKLICDQPSLAPPIIGELNSILLGGDTKSYDPVLAVLNMVAAKDSGLLVDSIEAIACCMNKGREDFHAEWKAEALEVLIKIYHRYPERIGIALPELFVCLENASPDVRENAYFLLSVLASSQPELFKGHLKDIIRILNGLYENERIYACKLIGKIAERNPEIIGDVYSIIEDISLNHPNSKLRSEATFTLEELRHPGKAGSDVPESISRETAVQKEAPAFSLQENNLTDKELRKNMFDSLLRNMISGSVIESIIIVDNEGDVLDGRGPPIDGSLVSEMVSQLSPEEGTEARSWVSRVHENKRIAAVRAGMKAIVVVMTARYATTGKVLMEINRSLPKVEKFVEDFF